MGDWLKLYRKIEDSEVFQDDDPALLKVWIWCLVSANYTVRQFKGIDILRGQFVTGRRKGSAAVGLDESKWYRCMTRLEKMGSISQKSNSEFTIVTVCNFETYQATELESEQQVNSESNNGRTTVEQPSNNNGTADEQQVNTRVRRKEGKKAEGKKDAEPPEGGPPKEPDKPHKPGPDTWLTPYGNIWTEVFGGEMPFAKFSKDFKDLERKHGKVMVAVRWRRYCESNRGRGEFASSAKFAQTYGQWSEDVIQPKDDPRGNFSTAEEYLRKKRGENVDGSQNGSE